MDFRLVETGGGISFPRSTAAVFDYRIEPMVTSSDAIAMSLRESDLVEFTNGYPEVDTDEYDFFVSAELSADSTENTVTATISPDCVLLAYSGQKLSFASFVTIIETIEAAVGDDLVFRGTSDTN